MSDKSSSVRVGLFGIGLDTYWAQFKGLKERLDGYLQQVNDRLANCGAEVINLGLVDSVAQSRLVGEQFRRQDVEIVFLYVSTYALSSTVLPVVQKAGVPVVVLNLQPTAAIDYEAFNSLGDRGLMTGEWLANCQACSAPEIACVFNRAGIPYHLVTGVLDEPQSWTEIQEWVSAAGVVKAMRDTRVGILGHYYCGMLDVYSDMTQQAAAFGCHFEILEMCRLKQFRDQVEESQIQSKLDQFNREFEVSPECSEYELRRAAQTSCALDLLVEDHQLGAMAYYYEGTSGNDYENIVTSVIAGNSLLTAHGVPVAGECEIKNVQAMKILDLLGMGGSFSELYLMDFKDDVVLLGHDGPGHMRIAEGPVKLVPLPLYHGKPGEGLSIEMMVQNGPVTLLALVQNRDGGLKLLVAEAESVAGPILHIGNTNSRYRFSIGAREFVNAWSAAGPAHHCAIGIGHAGNLLKKLASLWGIEYQQIC